MFRAPPLEEEIWGFRLYDQQDRQLVFLEFLFAVFNASGKPTDKGIKTPLISGSSHLVLRALLFSNTEINFCSNWDEWIEKFSKHMEDKFFSLTNWNANSLKQTFISFDEFRQVLVVIRQSLDKKDADRNWYYKFLFPWSKNQIFPDVEYDRENSEAFNLLCARHYFVHTGELAYLLCLLSDKHEDLLNAIKVKFQSSSNPLARLCSLVEEGFSDNPVVSLPENGTFLPGNSLQDPNVKIRAEWMAEDILSVLNLNLKNEDSADFLSRIIGLHLICYYLERAKYIAQDLRLKGDGNIFMLCEIVQPESTPVRKQARLNFQQNQKLGLQVLLENFNKKISAVENAKPENRESVYQLEFNTKKRLYDDEKDKIEYDFPFFKNEIKKSLEKKFIKHLGYFHQRMAIDIGLASRDFTITYRYTLSDELLLTLVYSVVKKSFVPMKIFLREIKSRYGIIIDETSAQAFSGQLEIETNDLVMNYKRLLRQLNGLGLLYHLSDGCDYVLNPYILAE